MLPCDFHKKRVPGPNHHYYAALLDGADSQRRNLRLCTFHSDGVASVLDPYLVDIETGLVANEKLAFTCSSCGKAGDGPFRTFFLTAYPRSQERTDYYCVVHRDCRLPDFIESLLGLA